MPIMVMNRPMPAEIALLRKAGMEPMILSRSGEMVTDRKTRPEMKTIARPCCQV